MLPRAADNKSPQRWHQMKLIRYDESEQDIVRRIMTAVIAEWDGLPNATRDGILRQACVATDPGAKPKSREEITAFIRKHADTQRA
jgi:hypothetical protein